MNSTTAEPLMVGAAALGRGVYRQRNPNMTARGESYDGQPVNYDARTGDVIDVSGETYDVVDTYPAHVRLERKTPYGPDVTVRSYRELREAGAIFSRL